eukprot:12910917-Prorocentrum_lima.AAC.1
MIPALRKEAIVVTPQREQDEVYQDGLLGHLVRAQLSVPHQDVEGEMAGEGRRAMGRTLNSISGK